MFQKVLVCGLLGLVLVCNMGTSCCLVIPTSVIAPAVCGPFPGGDDVPGGGMPDPSSDGGFIVNGLTYTGSAFQLDGSGSGAVTMDFSGLIAGVPPYLIQIYGPDPGQELVAQAANVVPVITWFPRLSGRYLVVITDSGGQAWRYWFTIVILVPGPTPPSPPGDPVVGELALVLTSPAMSSSPDLGSSVTFSGSITGGSPPFVLQIDLYDNRRFIVQLGTARQFSKSYQVGFSVNYPVENLIQITSGDGQIDHRKPVFTSVD